MWYKLGDFFYRLIHTGVKDDMTLSYQRKVILSNIFSLLLFVILIAMNIILHLIGAPFSGWSYFAIPLVLVTFIFNYYSLSKLNGLVFSTLTAFFTLLFGTLAIMGLDEVPIVAYFFPRFVMLSALILPYILIDIKHKRSIIVSTLGILLLIFLFDPFHRWLGVDLSQVNIELATYSTINILIIIPIAIILFGIRI